MRSLPHRSLLSVAFLPWALLAACHGSTPAASGPPAPPAAQGVETAASKEITRRLLSQQDVQEMPGWETRLYLIEYPPGVQAPRHAHPAVGIGYVLEGRFESAFEGEMPAIVEAGHSFVDKADVVHVLFRNPDPLRPLRFLIAYTIRKGEPLMRVV